LIPDLVDDTRFREAGAMARRFEAAVARWRTSGDIRPVINDGNELCAF